MHIALVTGSSTGIGYATVIRLARDGCHVIATMRDPSSSDLADVASRDDLGIEVRELDVTDASDVDRTFGSVIADHGAVNVLVNNAGVTGGGAVEEAGMEVFAQAMDTNFFGALRCTKAVLPSMRERGSGCIVSVTSQAGRIAVPTMAAYSASKFALEATMEVLAAEVKQFGIRVALIEPGAILTPMIGKNAMPSPDTAYGLQYQHFGTLAIHDFGQGSTADVVADCIGDVVASDAPLLRHPVGQGAERNIRQRASMSDEENIALWNEPDDALFLERMLGGRP